MHKPPRSFANFFSTPENHSALLAVQDLAANRISQQPNTYNPLLLFGPAGTGKSHLVSALVEQVTRLRSDLAVEHLSASDFTQTEFFWADREDDEEENKDALFAGVREKDLLVVEDLQHLHASTVGPFTELVDTLLSNGQQLVLTANAGPLELQQNYKHFSMRLINRLSGGIAVNLHPWPEKSRRLFLQEQTKPLSLNEDVLHWLARHLTGGVRQLLGAITQLETLARCGGSLTLDTIAAHFQTQADSAKLTVEVIARQVSDYFQVDLGQLQSPQRGKSIMVPRQVSMYLARRLTGLSLEQIGAYFGGRDHSTVLHACRKVEKALDKDLVLSGAIRQLQAELV